MKTFVWRKYISVGLALSFFMIFISGIILYIAPAGRIARWIDWSALGLNRAQWETQHTLFSYLFIVFGLIHLFSMNWKSFTSYFINGFKHRIRSKKEALFALFTVLMIFFLTLFKVPPVISVMDLGNSISDTWADKTGEPPAHGIESMSVDEIAELFFESDTDLVFELLEKDGYIVNSKSQTLSEIAAENHISPMKLFKFLDRN